MPARSPKPYEAEYGLVESSVGPGKRTLSMPERVSELVASTSYVPASFVLTKISVPETYA